MKKIKNLLLRSLKRITKVSCVIILSLIVSTVTLTAKAQDDKPASKKDAAAVQTEFDRFKNGSRKGSFWGSAESYIKETDHPYYATLLQHLKTDDSLALSKLKPADKFYIISVRRTQSPDRIWKMDAKDLVRAALLSGFEHALYFSDITISPDIYLAEASSGKSKIFKSDLLYKNEVIEKNAIVCIKDDGSFYIPATGIRNQYFTKVIAADIQASGLSEEAYLVRMTKKINIREEHTLVWNPNVSLEYWSNNKRKASRVYQSGKQHGTTKEYNFEGILTAKLEYQANHLHGIQLRYENGKLSSESTYDDGEPIGLHTTFYENGKISRTLSYKDGKSVTLKTYDEAGLIDYENTANYAIYYYPNGKKKSEGPTGTFGRTKVWKFYNDNGKLVKEQEYLMNSPYGSEKLY